MKNIHVLPTEKPSRLHLGNSGLVLCESVLSKYTINGQNIFITSDEQLKFNDYYIIDGKEIYYCNTLNPKRNNNYKKIILTTDQDLIKDGVQAIDDEFLEWFVKNPSCEFVDVEELRFFNSDTNESAHCKWVTFILQEELKQETFIKPDNVDGQWLSPVPTERAWQEEKLVDIFDHYPNASPKWQYMNGLIQNSLDAKQMYSEEDMILYSDYVLMCSAEKTLKLPLQPKEWFEQFKKK